MLIFLADQPTGGMTDTFVFNGVVAIARDYLVKGDMTP
jgi:hypothetical protein